MIYSDKSEAKEIVRKLEDSVIKGPCQKGNKPKYNKKINSLSRIISSRKVSFSQECINEIIEYIEDDDSRSSRT